MIHALPNYCSSSSLHLFAFPQVPSHWHQMSHQSPLWSLQQHCWQPYRPSLTPPLNQYLQLLIPLLLHLYHPLPHLLSMFKCIHKSLWAQDWYMGQNSSADYAHVALDDVWYSSYLVPEVIKQVITTSLTAGVWASLFVEYLLTTSRFLIINNDTQRAICIHIA